MFAEFAFGGLAVAHNGNLTNSHTLRRRLVQQGCIFQSTMDTEVIIHLMATSRYHQVVDRVVDALRQVEGAYSAVALCDGMLIGVRDPMGVRPLIIGEIDGATILTSESCALDIIGATFVRDVEPGEMVVVDETASIRSVPSQPDTADSASSSTSISRARTASSKDAASMRRESGSALNLAIEAPVDADVVIPVPDSGVPAAMGYAEQAGIPFELGIIRNHYVGRTFIEPGEQIRHLGVKLEAQCKPGPGGG